jgi:hypothetical protein
MSAMRAELRKSGDFFVVVREKTAINCLMPGGNSRFPRDSGGQFPNVRRLNSSFCRSAQEFSNDFTPFDHLSGGIRNSHAGGGICGFCTFSGRSKTP